MIAQSNWQVASLLFALLGFEAQHSFAYLYFRFPVDLWLSVKYNLIFSSYHLQAYYGSNYDN